MGHTPYGYRIEGGKAVIHEVEAANVRKLFDGYIGGLALKPAAEAAGIHVTHCQAKRMLQNSKYLGTEFYPAIVSTELMEQAKEQISSRATALGRNFEPKEKEKLAVQKKFALGHLEHRYEDPFRQAEYAYSLIAEVQTNG